MHSQLIMRQIMRQHMGAIVAVQVWHYESAAGCTHSMSPLNAAKGCPKVAIFVGMPGS